MIETVSPTQLVVMQDAAKADVDAARRLLDRAFEAYQERICPESIFEYFQARCDLRDSIAVAEEWGAELR